MAVTLSQVAKLEKAPLKKGVIMNILRDCPVMEWMPFENVDSLTTVAVRATKLPTVTFRRLNAGYSQSEADVDQVYERIYPFGGDIELDRIYKKLGKQNFLKDPRAFNIDMHVKAMAITFGYYLINGDAAVNPDGFEGLKKRISNMPARQKIRASGTTDVLDPTASVANARRFLDKWDEAFQRAGGGVAKPNVIMTNEGVATGFGRVLRYLGASGGALMDMSKDSFDRDYVTYKGVPIVDMGLWLDQSTEIIPRTETAEDAGADATSVYMMPFHEEQGVQGIQLSDMEVYDPLNGGEKSDKPAEMVRVEWVVGLYGVGSYGATRLHNIEDPDNWT